MNVAFVIAHSNSHTTDFGEVKVRIVLVVVRGDPAHPDTGGLLPSKDPHRIIILKINEKVTKFEWREKKYRLYTSISILYYSEIKLYGHMTHDFSTSRELRAHCGGIQDDLRIISVVRDHIFHQSRHRRRSRRRSERRHGSFFGLGEESSEACRK